MKDGFKKFQAKFHKEALVKIITGSFACGLFVLSVVLFVLRLQGLIPTPAFCVIVGVGAAAVSAVILWLILYENEKRIAKRVDKEWDLDERVQTMTEYKNVEGDMVALQRRTTQNKLAELDAPFTWKRVWAYLLALILALGVFFTAVFIPLRREVDADEPPIVTEKPFALTEYHRLAMSNLIAEVEESGATSAEKTSIVSALNKLLQDLEPVDKQKRMVELVTETMLTVDGVADRENTCDDLYKLFSSSEFAVVDDFAVWIATTDLQAMEQNLTVFRANFQSEEDAQAANETLKTFVGSATGALTLASTTMDGDGLYLATKAIVDKFASVSAQALTDYTTLNTALSTGVSETKGALELALDQQFKNREISDRAIDRLQTIFEISDLDVPDFENDWLTPSVDNTQGTDQDDDNLNSGGLPEGDKHYASDDEIFDPDTGEYVPYGEVITEYQKYINEIAASLSEELRQYYNEYFQTLRGATEE